MDRISANPFCYKLKLTKNDYLKMLLMVPIGLLRSAFIIILLFLLYLTSNICYLFKIIINPINYYEKKNYYLFLPLQLMKFIFYVLGIRIKNVVNYNKNKTYNSNIYIFAPHSSIFDMIPLLHLGITSIVARYETQNIWLMSRFVQLLDLILVKRDNSISRIETINQIKLRSQREKIGIFCEGTCTNREQILKFRLGAFSPALPVQPVYIEYDETSKNNTIWTYEGPTYIKLLMLTILKWKTEINLYLLPIYFPSTDEVNNIGLYGRNVNNYFCKFLKLRQSFYNFEDPKFLDFTKTRGIPRSAVCLKLVKLCYKILMLKHELNNKNVVDTTVNKYFEKKNSIGSISSINNNLHFNWILELEITFNQFIEKNLKRLSQVLDLSKKISTLNDLIHILNLKGENIVNSKTLEDFYLTLKGQSHTYEPTYLDLFLLFKLCDTRAVLLLDRIRQCLSKILSFERNLTHSHSNQSSISYGKIKVLIWYLLSLDERILCKSNLDQVKLDLNFFKLYLPKYFRRAVEENANNLFEEKY